MKRLAVGGAIVVLALLSIVAVALADDPPIYYVRLDSTGCEDGSETCPYNTLAEAIAAGTAQVCVGRPFEIHMWDNDSQSFKYMDTRSGAKPIPGTGFPIAQPVLILMVALVGALLVGLALYVRKRAAH
jgi:hypothetical protein